LFKLRTGNICSKHEELSSKVQNVECQSVAYTQCYLTGPQIEKVSSIPMFATLPAIFIRLSVIPFYFRSSCFSPLSPPFPQRAAAVFLTNLYVHIKLVGRGKSVALGISWHPQPPKTPRLPANPRKMANTYVAHTLTHSYAHTQLPQSVGFHYLIATLDKFGRNTRRMRNAARK